MYYHLPLMKITYFTDKLPLTFRKITYFTDKLPLTFRKITGNFYADMLLSLTFYAYMQKISGFLCRYDKK